MSSSSSASLYCTTRSRTGLFLSYRESIPRTRPTSNYADDDEQEHLITTPRHAAIDVPLPPKWVDFSDQVELILADTQAKITALDKLHAKHVLPGFSDRSLEEREIDALTTDITRDFRQCQSLIQKIGLPQHSFPPSRFHSQAQSEALAAKNVQRGLAVKVQDLSAAFRKKQRVYMEKLQGHAIKNQDMLIASGAISLKGSEGISAVDDDVAAARHTQSQSLSLSQSQSQSLLADTYDQDQITSRTHSLNELANSISNLAELFKDLSTLIIDQGTLLDSVEYNIEQTAVRVSEAVVELEEAKGYQNRTGRRRCIFLLVLLVMLAATALVIKIRRGGRSVREEKSGSPPPPPMTTVGSDDNVVAAIGRRRYTEENSNFDPWEVGRPPINSRIVRRRWRGYMNAQPDVAPLRT